QKITPLGRQIVEVVELVRWPSLPSAGVVARSRWEQLVQQERDKEIGGKVRALRTRASLSQEDVAFAVVMGKSPLSKVERVGPAKISWSLLCKIAGYFGTTMIIKFEPVVGQSDRTLPPEFANIKPSSWRLLCRRAAKHNYEVDIEFIEPSHHG